MDLLILFVFILSGIIGIGHGADLLWGIDPVTGLCTVGSVWWRYAALGAVLLAALLAGRRSTALSDSVRCRRPLAGALAFAGAVCFLAAGVTQLLFAAGISALVRAVLQLLCGGWLFCLGRSWLTQKPWAPPTRSLVPAVFGTVVFYWNVLMCFMENSSSWHRVQPTAAVWQQMAAVLFLEALLHALYLPETENSKTLGAAGLAAFALCLCWQLPQTLFVLLTEGAALYLVPELASGLGLCCVGCMGGICAVKYRAEKHAK